MHRPDSGLILCRFFALRYLRAYQRTTRAMTSSGKPCCEKALVDRAVKRRPQSLQRHRCGPSRVCPSLRVRLRPHRMHCMITLSSTICGDRCTAHSVATKPRFAAYSAIVWPVSIASPSFQARRLGAYAWNRSGSRSRAGRHQRRADEAAEEDDRLGAGPVVDIVHREVAELALRHGTTSSWCYENRRSWRTAWPCASASKP